MVDKMKPEAKSVDMNPVQLHPSFDGYPYIVICITADLYHINLLSKQHDDSECYFRIAQAQADANKLDVCLVKDSCEAVYFKSNQKPFVSEHIPWASVYTSGKLRLAMDQLTDADLLLRKRALDDFIQQNTVKGGVLLGDLTKGGHEASQYERINLRGIQENGTPKGLELCPVCGEYRGNCIDPNPHLPGLVVRVSCRCDNDNLCAYCGERLHSRKLNANYYNLKDGKIWHTPAFCGLNHRCAGSIQ